MVPYRALQPKSDRQKSPRKAARERFRADAALATADVASLPKLPAAPTKLQQLEALVRAGRANDPLAQIKQKLDSGFAPVARPGMTQENQPSLTERVRDLYENSIVPVREIARLAGVTERTLYRYVERHGWQRRHVCRPRDDAVRAANSGRTLTPRQGFAGVKGAGGRFVPRDEAGAPHASGLKALDPLAAEQAVAATGRAHLLSDIATGEAVAEAEIRAAAARRDKAFERDVRSLNTLARTMRELTAMALKERQRAEREQAAAERERLAKEKDERDAEELRRDLERRVIAMIESDQAAMADDAARAAADEGEFDGDRDDSTANAMRSGPRVRGF
jgi:hypothetical protein